MNLLTRGTWQSVYEKPDVPLLERFAEAEFSPLDKLLIGGADDGCVPFVAWLVDAWDVSTSAVAIAIVFSKAALADHLPGRSPRERYLCWPGILAASLMDSCG